MPKHKVMVERDDGWTDTVLPQMTGYRMSCCDCGLVHEMNFEVYKIIASKVDGTRTVRPMPPDKYQVAFKAKRNDRSTAQVRRHKKGWNDGNR